MSRRLEVGKAVRRAVRALVVVFVFGCARVAPTGEIVLVVDGTVEIPRDIDWLHIDVRSADHVVHSGDYRLGANGFSLPGTLGVVPGSEGQRDVKVRVLGRSGGAAGIVRMLREAHTQVPVDRIVVLPMNLAVTCLDFVRDQTSPDTESSCGPGRTCVAGSCAPVEIPPSELPPYVPGADHKGDDGVIEVVAPSDRTTSEAGRKATIVLRLGVKPSSAVHVPLASSRPTEGSVAVSEVVFTPDDWATEHRVEVVGVDDAVVDGDAAYTLVLGEATSEDRRYQGLDAADVDLVNVDDDQLASCLAILRVDPTASSGVYVIDADGSGPLAAFEVACDMTTAGGGFTLVARELAGSTSALQFLARDGDASAIARGTGSGSIGRRLAGRFDDFRIVWGGEHIQLTFAPRFDIFSNVVNTSIPVSGLETSDPRLAGWVQIAGGATFCLATRDDDVRPGDTSWAIKPKSDDYHECGCNSGNWLGQGAYYGGAPAGTSTTCSASGGGWAGVKDTGEGKALTPTYETLVYVR